jgi:hypothetical protein
MSGGHALRGPFSPPCFANWMIFIRGKTRGVFICGDCHEPPGYQKIKINQTQCNKEFKSLNLCNKIT